MIEAHLEPITITSKQTTGGAFHGEVLPFVGASIGPAIDATAMDHGVPPEAPEPGTFFRGKRAGSSGNLLSELERSTIYSGKSGKIHHFHHSKWEHPLFQW